MSSRSIEERFWSKVKIGAPDECWEWQAGLDGKGYGSIQINGSPKGAHRISYIFTFGDPGNLHVCHKCDNPPCCNPNHLFLGTARDNAQDAIKKGRRKKRVQKSQRKTLAKLTVEQVREIRKLYKNGSLTYKKLSQLFSISVSQIERIINYKHWKYEKGS